jgi:hypothetical protein
MNSHHIRSICRDNCTSLSPDVYQFDNPAIHRKTALAMRQILSDSEQCQSRHEDPALQIDSLAGNISRDTETEFEARSDLDESSIIQRHFDRRDTFQRRPPYMSVFRKIWLVPVPFCVATVMCSAFWNLGQITGSWLLSEITAVIAYPLVLLLLSLRLFLPVRHNPLLDLNQKLVSLPLTIVSAIFAGWMWSVVADDHGVISSRWDLCWWCMLVGITCGMLAYL